MIELYSENILALDVCATSKKKLDDLQIRLYMDTLANNITVDSNLFTGVPTCNLTANLVVNVTRLGDDIHTFRLQSLNKGPEHYKYLEMRYDTTVIPANSNPAPAFNYVLNSVTNPNPSTLNPNPSTLNSKPQAHNPKP